MAVPAQHTTIFADPVCSLTLRGLGNIEVTILNLVIVYLEKKAQEFVPSFL